MERRLSAILAADMVGYSRLMEADEIGTLERQKVHRSELIDPVVGKFRGRIVKEMGDGILVEFPSVVDAVACAVEIQKAMPARGSYCHQGRPLTGPAPVTSGSVATARVTSAAMALGRGASAASPGAGGRVRNWPDTICTAPGRSTGAAALSSPVSQGSVPAQSGPAMAKSAMARVSDMVARLGITGCWKPRVKRLPAG